MKSFIVFLSLGICLVTAQTPLRCASPQTWHARLVRDQVDMREGVREHILGKVAYDELNQRFSIFEEEFTHDGYRRNVSAHFYFYKDRTEYRVDYNNEECERRLLNESFHPISVPDDAKWVDRVEIGSNAGQGTGVSVDIWEGQTFDSVFTSVWTTKDCIPVEDRYFNHQYLFTTQTFFYDVEFGINPDDIIPPKYCNYPPPPLPPK